MTVFIEPYVTISQAFLPIAVLIFAVVVIGAFARPPR